MANTGFMSHRRSLGHDSLSRAPGSIERMRPSGGHPDFAAARGADLLKFADIAEISGLMKKASLAGVILGRRP